MNNLPTWLWFVPILPALGFGIDFLLGRAGQARTRGFLEDWWIRFDEITWNNFGSSEAAIAYGLIGKWCGARFFSTRRWVFVFIVLLAAYVFGFIYTLARHGPFDPRVDLSLDIIFSYAGDILGFGLAISYIRGLSRLTTRLCRIGTIRNFAVFTAFLFLSYFSLIYWNPLLQMSRAVLTLDFWAIATHFDSRRLTFYLLFPFYIIYSTMAGATILWLPSDVIRDFGAMFDNIFNSGAWNGNYGIIPLNMAGVICGFVPIIIRLMIYIVFVCSFITRPLIMRPLSLLWLRIVESEKPIFSLAGTGVAAVITGGWYIGQHI